MDLVPCEFEINIANKILFNRDYRGELESPFWRIDGLYCSVFFSKEVELKKAEKIVIKTDSIISVMCSNLEGFIKKNQDGTYTLPQGKYELNISAYNNNYRLPTIYVYGETVFSDESWSAMSNAEEKKSPWVFLIL